MNNNNNVLSDSEESEDFSESSAHSDTNWFMQHLLANAASNMQELLDFSSEEEGEGYEEGYYEGEEGYGHEGSADYSNELFEEIEIVEDVNNNNREEVAYSSDTERFYQEVEDETYREVEASINQQVSNEMMDRVAGRAETAAEAFLRERSELARLIATGEKLISDHGKGTGGLDAENYSKEVDRFAEAVGTHYIESERLIDEAEAYYEAEVERLMQEADERFYAEEMGVSYAEEEKTGSKGEEELTYSHSERIDDYEQTERQRVDDEMSSRYAEEVERLNQQAEMQYSEGLELVMQEAKKIVKERDAEAYIKKEVDRLNREIADYRNEGIKNLNLELEEFYADEITFVNARVLERKVYRDMVEEEVEEGISEGVREEPEEYYVDEIEFSHEEFTNQTRAEVEKYFEDEIKLSHGEVDRMSEAQSLCIRREEILRIIKKKRLNV